MQNLGHDLLFGLVAADAYAARLKEYRTISSDKESQSYSLNATLALYTAEFLISGEEDWNQLYIQYHQNLQEKKWVTSTKSLKTINEHLSSVIYDVQGGKDFKKIPALSEPHLIASDMIRLVPIILPLLKKKFDDRFRFFGQSFRPITREEYNIRCFTLCYQFIHHLLRFKNKNVAFKELQQVAMNFCEANYDYFKGLADPEFLNQPVEEYFYPHDTLLMIQQCLHAFMNTESYEEAVLEAATAKHHPSETITFTGAIAGIFYGVKAIPKDWRTTLKNKKAIKKLARKLEKKFHKTIEFPIYEPITHYHKRHLFYLARKTYGDEIISYKDQFMAVDHLDTTTEEFYDYWYPIYCNLMFAYGVKYNYIELNDEPITVGNHFDYEFDPCCHIKYLAEQYPAFNQTKKDYYEINNIEIYIKNLA